MTTRDQTIEAARAEYANARQKAHDAPKGDDGSDAWARWANEAMRAKERLDALLGKSSPSTEPARAARRDRLETERNELDNSFGQGPFKDGQIRDRIAAIDAELVSLPAAEPARDYANMSTSQLLARISELEAAALVPVQQGVEGERVLSGPMQFDKPEPTDADAETLKEMQAQLWAAGLDLEESAFVAKMLFRNGQRVTRASPPPPVHETVALKTIAEFPITDPKNQDAVNMAAIARTSLNVPTPVRETVTADHLQGATKMVEAALAAYLEQAAKQMIGTSSPSGNRPTHVYNLVDAHEDDEPIFTGSDEQCRNFCMKRSLTAALSAALAQPVEPWKPTLRHKKRGTEYMVLHEDVRLQTDKPLEDYSNLTIYRGHDGQLWARSRVEMSDGRFETLPDLEALAEVISAGGSGNV